MKLRLISDGTADGTRVVNDATEEPVENVSLVAFELDAAKGVCTGTLRFEFLKVDLRISAGRG